MLYYFLQMDCELSKFLKAFVLKNLHMGGSLRLLYNPSMNLLFVSTKRSDTLLFKLFILSPGETIEIA